MRTKTIFLWIGALLASSLVLASLTLIALERMPTNFAFRLGEVTGYGGAIFVGAGTVAAILYAVRRKVAAAMWTWTVLILVWFFLSGLGWITVLTDRLAPASAKLNTALPERPPETVDAPSANGGSDRVAAIKLDQPLPDQTLLGLMYEYGLRGAPQDYAEAAKWYRKAADQGDSTAQQHLGAMYARGDGVPQDYAEAAKWYRKAAKQGDAFAQDDLGALYHGGQGVPQDYAEAAQWYRKAADQGNARAQLGIGFMYLEGKGVPQDYLQAHKWLNLASAGIPASDKKVRDMAVKERDAAAAEMTPAQIAEAQKQAREWKPIK